MQFMGIFLVEQFQQPSPGRLGHLQIVQQAGDKTHVADFQHRGYLQRCQTLQRQPDHLRLGRRIHRAHALQAHLVDGLEGVALPAGTADLFIIIEALALPRRRLGRLGNGQRHVRLDGPQLAVQVGEGHHLGIGQKPLILLVEGVLLKPGTAILAIACPLVQSPQPERGLFRRGKILQLDFHIKLPASHTYRFIIL